MIVVVQFVLALRVHALRSLPYVSLFCRAHGQVTRPGGLHGRERKVALERCTFALGARRGGCPSHEGFKRVTTVLAGVFVDRYDDTRRLK